MTRHSQSVARVVPQQRPGMSTTPMTGSDRRLVTAHQPSTTGVQPAVHSEDRPGSSRSRKHRQEHSCMLVPLVTAHAREVI
jgi:hypothetical protein